MILKALDDGIPEHRFARPLARFVTTIRTSITMLRDICPAIERRKDEPAAAAALTLFKHVKPLRQIEMAEPMNRMGAYTKPYAAGLVSRTRPELLAELPEPKKSTLTKPEGLAQMELKIQSLEKASSRSTSRTAAAS